ncbi:unnamed protein product [Brassicogethes aeneus]|uniref:Uncharacterized protein n=1 Tax=Brassicogethes aeneus TaxID=1431903 RepID=A0A9P0FI52_BRAAE|nr:unnamed protein product [Brassicogethes aeneus]
MEHKRFVCIFFIVIGAAFIQCSDKDTGAVLIHATANSSVPSIEYIVDAVELFKTAYEIYPDDENRAKAYIQLYGEKYNETTWNVVTCYTSLIINAKHYVELSVTHGKTKSDSKPCLVMLFSRENNLERKKLPLKAPVAKALNVEKLMKEIMKENMEY